VKHNVDHLRSLVLHSEYEEAQDIRLACREEELAVSMGFAVAYKAGLIEGKKSSKANISKVYRDLADAREQVKILEGANENLSRLIHLLCNPEPDRDIEELVAEIDAYRQQEAQRKAQQEEQAQQNDPQPTPGDNWEEELNDERTE